MRKIAIIVSSIGLFLCLGEATYQLFMFHTLSFLQLIAVVPFSLALAALYFSAITWLNLLAKGVNAIWSLVGVLIAIGSLYILVRGKQIPVSPVLTLVVALFWNAIPGAINFKGLSKLSAKGRWE